MKKLLFVFLGVILMVGLFGCGGEEELSFARMIPNPNYIFADGVITVTDDDGGSTYMFNITNFTQEQVRAFIDGSIAMGFVDIYYDTENNFGARTEEGRYWIEVNQDREIEILYVVVQISRAFLEEYGF